MTIFSHAIRLSTILAFVLLTGCAVFPQQKVATVQLPIATAATQKPSAYANVQVFRGKPGNNAKELSPSLPGLNKAIDMIRKNVDDSGLFSSVSYDSSTKADADLNLNVRVYNHGDIGAGAMIAAFITGFTFYVVPSTALESYTVQVDVADKAGQSLAHVSNEDSMRMWQGLIFLPMAGNTMQKGFESTVGNQIRAALKEAHSAGKLNTANR